MRGTPKAEQQRATERLQQNVEEIGIMRALWRQENGSCFCYGSLCRLHSMEMPGQMRYVAATAVWRLRPTSAHHVDCMADALNAVARYSSTTERVTIIHLKARGCVSGSLERKHAGKGL